MFGYQQTHAVSWTQLLSEFWNEQEVTDRFVLLGWKLFGGLGWYFSTHASIQVICTVETAFSLVFRNLRHFITMWLIKNAPFFYSLIKFLAQTYFFGANHRCVPFNFLFSIFFMKVQLCFFFFCILYKTCLPCLVIRDSFTLEIPVFIFKKKAYSPSVTIFSDKFITLCGFLKFLAEETLLLQAHLYHMARSASILCRFCWSQIMKYVQKCLHLLLVCAAGILWKGVKK